MKKNVIFLLLMMTGLFLNAQNYSKGDFLINADVQVTEISPDIETVPATWDGPPLHISLNYFLFKTKIASFSTGLHTTYFRHQPGDGENYETLGLALPAYVHLTLLKKLDTYVGYRVGYYFDGYKPESKQTIGQYEGTYSEMCVGLRYFFIPRFAAFIEATSSELQVNAGVSFKL